ncbi:penicillin-binding protein 2 [Lipingzhangella sp. LS1_29]|uniref:Penicillin-binding protein 2 n=1 Tax=Lipingzhangella rawalii TaxID=2055835 RepID=A0ABU2H8D6_9ACTN|nr:penicillin-binding protein 2 [Lipingzhangella rawalii]MDS1271119.1 penicillin-binding protein 2 [Lipingzhangella rawalii]
MVISGVYPGRGRGGILAVQIVAVALLLALTGRLWYLQVPMHEHYRERAAENRIQELVVPAVRGSVLDAAGRPLVQNRSELVVSGDYHELAAREDGGDEVLRRLAELLDEPYAQLRKRTRLCGPDVQRPCWPGSPHQPITLAEDVSPQRALQILERQEDFPGISAQQQAVRDYPLAESAAQILGYLQPVTEEELAERDELRTAFTGVDQVGRDGLEAQYDRELRGEPGLRRLAVDTHGNVTQTLSDDAPVPGSHLVTSLDSEVQRVAEEALRDGIQRAQDAGDPADSGAAVVMDVRDGSVLALASVPSYDPSVWDGGIDQDTYEELLGEEAGQPLTSRAVHGEYPPASTFKVSSLAAAVAGGASLDGTYGCPSSYQVGDRAFENYESSSYGSISLHQSIVVSCNTVFYRFAHEQWRADGGTDPTGDPDDHMVRTAEDFGFGEPTGIDLPSEAGGRIPGREWKQEYWEATREESCTAAEEGYPDVDDPVHERYLRAVAAEHCSDGYVWRAGDAANFSIGQGDVLVTPLQLARAYAAIANGGTLYEPRLGRALVSADGSEVQEIEPREAGQLPVDDTTLGYLQRALADVPEAGTAAGAFADFPLEQFPVAGKTGTATQTGYEPSAWFASYAPADEPRLAVVAYVAEGGTGGSVAAPVVRDIYTQLYGQDGTDGVLPGGEPLVELPEVQPDGSVEAPERTRP